MKNQIVDKINKYAFQLTTGFLSLIVFSILILTLQHLYSDKIGFTQTLSNVRETIITISGILSSIIIAYLTSKVLQIRQERMARLSELKELTQKTHKFRGIINKLIHSNLWVKGLRNFVDNTYKELTHSDIQAISIVGGETKKIASDFVQDNKYGDTKYLYLEMKSFILDNPFDNTLYAEFEVPVYYNTKVLEYWIKNDCGNGLYYYFDHKYGAFKGDLDLNNVHTYYSNHIEKICLEIDKERYEKFVFGNKLLSKIGEQFTSDILPRLYRLQIQVEAGLPTIINYLFFILIILIVFGVALPFLTLLYSLKPTFDIISISVIISTTFYLLISFYYFLKKEVEV